MTNEINYQPGKLDLARFSDKELEGMVPLIEKELVKRREMRQKEALEKMRTIAESVGMTPEELLGLELPRRRRTTKRTPTSGLQHPDDPSKVYRGGRKPAWLKTLNEEGREPVKVT